MRITIMLILALILAIIVTIFAVQNNMPIDITFLAWKLDGSLALILMLTFASGILIGLLVSTPTWIRRVRQSYDLRKNLRTLERELEEARMAADSQPLEKPGQAPSSEVVPASENEEETIKDAS